MSRIRINYKSIFNRYTHLLALLLVFFLCSPLLTKETNGFPLFSFIFLTAIVLTFRALFYSKKYFLLYALVAVFLFCFDVVLSLNIITIWAEQLAIVNLALYALFLFIGIILFINRVFSLKYINLDIIRGGFCIYLLIGFFWTILYFIVLLLDQSAFITTNHYVTIDLFSFSFTTLTTLGYGDIVPNNGFSRVLTNLEAICGQLYLTVFVARLVGIYIVQELNKPKQ